MAAERDPHGQPLNLSLNRDRRIERDLSEMLGLAKGMLADGIVNDLEAAYIHKWAADHPDAIDKWPVSMVLSRVQQFFADGLLDEPERKELQELLGQLVGGRASVLLGYTAATTLPLDVPAPLISWENEHYVFTGRFAYGTRKDCEGEVLERGGAVEPNITRATTFLVIGTFGSEDWAQGSYGLKIRKAVKLRESGFAIRIVGEDHWATALSAAPI